MKMNQLTVAYGGMSSDYSAPGDRRRFAGYALRNEIQLVSTSHKGADAVVLTLGADISQWKILKEKHGFLILDIVDAYLDESFFSPKRIFRGMYKSLNGTFSSFNMSYQKLLRDLIRGADVVVCASEEQRTKLLELNSNVYALVDCFDELLAEKSEYPTNPHINKLIWEGYPDNLRHLEIMQLKNQNYRFEIVSLPRIQRALYLKRSTDTSAYLRRFGMSFHLVHWTIENLKLSANSNAIAVIPIDSKLPMAWNKSENKLLGMWSLGIPVLMSPTPSYSRVANEAGLEPCLVDDRDWNTEINSLLNDPMRAHAIVHKGYSYARKNSSSITLDPKWMNVLNSIGINP